MKRAFARFRTGERSSDRRLQDFKRIELARLGAGSLGKYLRQQGSQTGGYLLFTDCPLRDWVMRPRSLECAR